MEKGKILDGVYWAHTKELIIAYASHIGHEIFHTSYFKYVHNPKYGTRKFVTKRDVTYKIDDIIEALIRKYYDEHF